MVVKIKFQFSTKVFLEVACNNIEYNIMLNILSKLVFVQNRTTTNWFVLILRTKPFFPCVHPKMERRSNFTEFNL